MDDAVDARERDVGKFSERLFEQHRVAGKERTQHKTHVKLRRLAQVADQRPRLAGHVGCNRYRCLFAGFLGHALCAVGRQPLPRRHEFRKRF